MRTALALALLLALVSLPGAAPAATRDPDIDRTSAGTLAYTLSDDEEATAVATYTLHVGHALRLKACTGIERTSGVAAVTHEARWTINGAVVGTTNASSASCIGKTYAAAPQLAPGDHNVSIAWTLTGDGRSGSFDLVAAVSEVPAESGSGASGSIGDLAIAPASVQAPSGSSGGTSTSTSSSATTTSSSASSTSSASSSSAAPSPPPASPPPASPPPATPPPASPPPAASPPPEPEPAPEDEPESSPEEGPAQDDDDDQGGQPPADDNDDDQGDDDADEAGDDEAPASTQPEGTVADSEGPLSESLVADFEDLGLPTDGVTLVDADGDGRVESVDDPTGRVQTLHAATSSGLLIVQDGTSDALVVVDALTGQAHAVAPVEASSVTVTEASDAAGEGAEPVTSVVVEVAEKSGWILVSFPDPAPGADISSIRRSDGLALATDLAWRDAGQVHFVDDPGVSYTLEFVPDERASLDADDADAAGTSGHGGGPPFWLPSAVLAGLAFVALGIGLALRKRST